MTEIDLNQTKRYRCEKFHSHLLIPWNIAQRAVNQNDIDPILTWIDAHQQGYKFKEGQEVAHKNNPRQVMFVQKILVANIELHDGKKFPKMIGILCHWWEDCPCVDDVIYERSEPVSSEHVVNAPNDEQK